MENSEKTLILYSGGSDSRLMLELAMIMQRDIHCLMIDYEQLHSIELKAAEKQLAKSARNYNKTLTWSKVKVSGLHLDSALTGDGVRGRFGSEDEISEWHVPGRNTMFAGIALSVAENTGCKTVWLGADFSDRLNMFIDCFQDFVVAMDMLYSYGASYQIKFEAPLMGLSKENVLSLIKGFKLDVDDLFSGYGKLQNDQNDTPEKTCECGPTFVCRECGL